MTTGRTYGSVVVGARLPAQRYAIDRLSLVPWHPDQIHWDPLLAQLGGRPVVIAHRMVGPDEAARLVTAWAGERAVVVDCEVRFSHPVVIPLSGVTVEVRGEVVDKLGHNRIELACEAMTTGRRVLSGARVVVELP